MDDAHPENLWYADYHELVNDFTDAVHPEKLSVVYNINHTDIAKINPILEFVCVHCLVGISLTQSIKIQQFFPNTPGIVSDTVKQQ
jgi:hypothetical protein